MPTKLMPWDDFCELADDHEVISRDNWRHGTHNTIVFKDDAGFYWRAKISVHSSDGWQAEETVKCTQVHKVTRPVDVWEPV